MDSSKKTSWRRKPEHLFVCLFVCDRLGCGAGQRGRSAARHAHLAHRAQEVGGVVQGTIPLPGRSVRAAGPGEEVPAQPASVSRHRLCVTTEALMGRVDGFFLP